MPVGGLLILILFLFIVFGLLGIWICYALIGAVPALLILFIPLFFIFGLLGVWLWWTLTGWWYTEKDGTK